MGEGEINNNEGGPKWDSVTLESHGRVKSHIFVKKTEGSSEKILTYVNVHTEGFLSRAKNNIHDLCMYNLHYFQTD